ncbi:MAG: CcdB family protein [Campylobacterota bacterium]|nr:CcdB family protein [Campylobacterota bacterium]
MAQFDVYRNPNSQSVESFPYLLDTQHDTLSSLNTRVVVPLAIVSKPIRHLNPVFEIEGQSVVMSTAQIAGVERTHCTQLVINLREHRNEIIDALDFLVNGF